MLKNRIKSSIKAAKQWLHPCERQPQSQEASRCLQRGLNHHQFQAGPNSSGGLCPIGRSSPHRG